MSDSLPMIGKPVVRTKSLLLGLGLFVWAFFGRWLLLGRTGVWLDEAFSIYYASQPLDWLIKHAAGLINHPPGYFLVLKGWMVGAGTDQVLLELLSVVLSLIAVGLFYHLARELFSPLNAYGLTSLFAIHPFLIYYSVELRMYVLALIGLIGAAIVGLRLVDESSPSRWIGLLAFTLICLYSHSLTLLYLLPGIVLLGWLSYRRNQLTQFGWYSLGLVVLYVPWFIYVARQAVRIKSDFWIPPFGLADLVRLFLAWGGYTLPHDPGLLYSLASVMVVLLFLGPVILSLKRTDEPALLLSQVTVAVPLLVISLVSLVGQSVFLTRGFLFALPFVVMLWGYGLTEMPFRFGMSLAGVFLIFLTLNTLRLHRNPPHQYLLGLQADIQSRYPSATTVVHTSKRTFFPFTMMYAKNRRNRILGDQIRPFFPADWERTLAQVKRGNPGRPVLFVIYRNEYPNWETLHRELTEGTASVRRTYQSGERVFELLYLPEGFTPNQSRFAHETTYGGSRGVSP